MEYKGYVRRMTHEYTSPITYFLTLGKDTVTMNDLIGETVELKHLGVIRCPHCDTRVNKLYGGYCYPCFKSIPEADLCIMKPHECHFYKGTCRNEEFGRTRCMIPHYVYLSYSSDVKVGLTYKGNEYRRWVDQGATQGIIIAELPTRKHAGKLEYILSKYFKDKTDFRKMLKDNTTKVDLEMQKNLAIEKVPLEYSYYISETAQIHNIVYPTYNLPGAVETYNLDKQPLIKDKLIGIKGSYLIFEHAVLNIYKHIGYQITLRY